MTTIWKTIFLENKHLTCHAIEQGMVFRYTWVFIPKTIQWHIHAGSWSLVNCLVGSLYEALYKVLMNINEAAVSLTEWPRPWWWSVYPHDTLTSPFFWESRGFACMQRTITRNIRWSLRDRVMQQIWMYYKEKLTKNLADLNTFETSMSFRDRVTT